MSIINAKKWTFRPRLLLPSLRLDNIENNADSVLIIVPNEALISICCVCSHDPVSFVAALGWFIVRYYNSDAWLKGNRLLFMILTHHLIRILHCQWLNLCCVTLLVHLLSYSDILPIAGKQLTQILLRTDESLASWGTSRPCCNLLLLLC